MNRNSIKVLGGLACILGLGVANTSATLSYSSTDTPITIADGNPVGITSTINADYPGTLPVAGDNVSVTLNLSGGNIGDLYAYLEFNGTKVVLMNQPGSGTYLGGGFSNVTLSDGNSINVDSYGGGSVNSVSFNPSAGSTAFQAFNGTSVAGTWTLFFADLSGGDGANVTTLDGWTLNLEAVPEPTNIALSGFAGGFASLLFIRRIRAIKS